MIRIGGFLVRDKSVELLDIISSRFIGRIPL